jgi:hypothetical protein
VTGYIQVSLLNVPALKKLDIENLVRAMRGDILKQYHQLNTGGSHL